jgi:hypothetical protein
MGDKLKKVSDMSEVGLRQLLLQSGVQLNHITGTTGKLDDIIHGQRQQLKTTNVLSGINANQLNSILEQQIKATSFAESNHQLANDIGTTIDLKQDAVISASRDVRDQLMRLISLNNQQIAKQNGLSDLANQQLEKQQDLSNLGVRQLQMQVENNDFSQQQLEELKTLNALMDRKPAAATRVKKATSKHTFLTPPNLKNPIGRPRTKPPTTAELTNFLAPLEEHL